MNEKQPQPSAGDLQWVLAQLVDREGGEPATLADVDEATLRDVEAQLETFVEHLRQPPPADDWAEESGCRRAVELVEQLAARPLSRDTSPAPQRIGPYEVLERLRQGGMGTVYKALHSKLQRVVAIKVLPRFEARDAASVARFEREMLALGSLSHRNIVAATDAGEADGMQYLVMEYVDGLDLSTISRRMGPLAAMDACEIVRQAADGVAEAHRRGIIHRDIKPSNLILVESGAKVGATVKVLDFGLARLAAECADEELTNSGQIMGTLKYMAPEQCASSREVDARADVYSLGATLYRLLSGQSPFAGARYESPPALVAAIATEQPRSLRELRSELDLELVAIVERLMTKDPAKRVSTPNELSLALEPFATGADLAQLLSRARAADGESSISTGRLAEPRLIQLPSASTADASRVSAPWYRVGAAVLFVAAAAGLYALLNAGQRTAPTSTEATTPFAARDPGVDPLVRSREVTEWILSRANSKAIALLEGRGEVELKPGDKVPSQPFQLLSVNLDGDKRLSDEDLRHFDQLPQFRGMGLSETSIGDEGLRQLGYLPALENLFLVDTEIGDEGVRQLQKYPLLRVLQLYGANVTDRGLKLLAEGNPALAELSLVDCEVTDAGLVHLSALKQLKLLALDRTGVTARGVAGLHIALPDCEIRSDFTAAEIEAQQKQR